jgi:hypothetical protein
MSYLLVFQVPSGNRLDVPTHVPHVQVLMDVPLLAQEVLENLKDRWYQADNPPADLLLTEDEFLSFLHPEHSRGMLKFMVKEIVRDLGKTCPPLACPSLQCSRTGGNQWLGVLYLPGGQ